MDIAFFILYYIRIRSFTMRHRAALMDLVSSSNQEGTKEVNSEGYSSTDVVESKTLLEPRSSGQVSQARKPDGDGSQVKQLKRTLPEGFFDKQGIGETKHSNCITETSERMDVSDTKTAKGSLPNGFFDCDSRNENKASSKINQSKITDGAPVKQAKGALPEGFFDNKDADLRARGIRPVKVDAEDAYKEFEKEIQDNLQEVDDRLEEEEMDAAAVMEQFELVEQMQYVERVEIVKKKLIEAKTAKVARGQKKPAFMREESSDESSSDGGDEEDNFAVDWRAQHL